MAASRAGDLARALETLRQVLAVDPEHAVAHARLSIVLKRMGRMHAALHEAEAAIALAPEEPLAHASRGLALMGHRRFADARQSLLTVIEMAPEESFGYSLLATLEGLEGHREAQGQQLLKAAALDPDDAATMAALGHYWLSVGNLEAAAVAIDDALAIEPQHVDGLTAKGELLLRRGDIDGARDHALWALSLAATDEDALQLLTAVKARTNRLLGAWWRWNAWMQTLGQGRSVVVLLAGFLLFRAGAMAAIDMGAPVLSLVLSLSWIALCVYSWVAPSIFARMLNREMRQVRLSSDY